MEEFRCIKNFRMDTGILGFHKGKRYLARVVGNGEVEFTYYFISEIGNSHTISQEIVDEYFRKPLKFGR